jgi:hypothetical protein
VTRTCFTAIYPGERLTLARDLETELLLVHLGTPPAVVQLGGFALRADAWEYLGEGSFEVWDGAELVHCVAGQAGSGPGQIRYERRYPA